MNSPLSELTVHLRFMTGFFDVFFSLKLMVNESPGYISSELREYSDSITLGVMACESMPMISGTTMAISSASTDRIETVLLIKLILNLFMSISPCIKILRYAQNDTVLFTIYSFQDISNFRRLRNATSRINTAFFCY